MSSTISNSLLTRTIDFAGPRGNQATLNTTQTKTGNGFTTTGSVTGSRGNTADFTRQTSTVDGTKTSTFTGKVTLSNGMTAELNGSRSVTRDGNSVTVHREMTGSNGYSKTVDRAYSRLDGPTTDPVPGPVVDTIEFA
jgi:hypothetical protein